MANYEVKPWRKHKGDVGTEKLPFREVRTQSLIAEFHSKDKWKEIPLMCQAEERLLKEAYPDAH